MMLKAARATLKKSETFLRYALAKVNKDPAIVAAATTAVANAQEIYDKCLAAHPDRKTNV